MISTGQLINEYRRLRQRSPFYDVTKQAWQVADYDSVQTILAHIARTTDPTTDTTEQHLSQAVMTHLQAHPVHSSCDLVQDVLEPLSQATLTPTARQIMPQVTPYLVDFLTGRTPFITLQATLPEPGKHTGIALQQIIQHELFITLAANTLYTLLTHPAQLAFLQVHPGYRVRAVQEVLRFAPPVHHLRWIAPADIQLSRTVISTGQSVDLIAAAAGRDSLIYHRADVFDSRRRIAFPVPVLHNAHIPHETVTGLLHYLLPAMRGMRLRSANALQWHRSNGWHRLLSLPVKMNSSAKK